MRSACSRALAKRVRKASDAGLSAQALPKKRTNISPSQAAGSFRRSLLTRGFGDGGARSWIHDLAPSVTEVKYQVPQHTPAMPKADDQNRFVGGALSQLDYSLASLTESLRATMQRS
jgi:hypothetical protein